MNEKIEPMKFQALTVSAADANWIERQKVAFSDIVKIVHPDLARRIAEAASVRD